MIKIALVAGARPNFMKIAPILRELDSRENVQSVLIHTGQHYDENMSAAFFSSLGIRAPDHFLEMAKGTHAVQTASVMVEFEKVCNKVQPDIVVVVGDINSTVAASLVAKKSHITLAHVEAGLRSFDRKMPEEINRLATDAISDLFFTTESTGTENLLREGQAPSAVHFVGHVMIDNLFYQLKVLDETPVLSEEVIQAKKKIDGKYICSTMHRPSNVDHKETLTRLVSAMRQLSLDAPLLFPCHPRTRQRLEQFGLIGSFKSLEDGIQGGFGKGIYITPPLSYNDFLYLWRDAALVLTDSGGLQEETTALQIPCITMRNNTERPITVDVGTNVVAGTDESEIVFLGKKALAGQWKRGSIPVMWDGMASERIVDVLVAHQS